MDGILRAEQATAQTPHFFEWDAVCTDFSAESLFFCTEIQCGLTNFGSCNVCQAKGAATHSLLCVGYTCSAQISALNTCEIPKIWNYRHIKCRSAFYLYVIRAQRRCVVAA